MTPSTVSVNLPELALNALEAATQAFSIYRQAFRQQAEEIEALKKKLSETEAKKSLG